MTSASNGSVVSSGRPSMAACSLGVMELGEGADQHAVEAVLALAAVGADHHAHCDRRAVDARA